MSARVVDSGKKVVRLTGVRSILNDIEKAKRAGESDIINLGAGNPVAIPAIQELWKRQYKAFMEESESFVECIGRYNQTRGLPMLLDEICEYFSGLYGVNLDREQVMVSPGSQAIYFYAANLFVGKSNGEERHLFLPNMPDYTGYGGVGMSDVPILGCMPAIEEFEESKFRYNLDWGEIDEQLSNPVGAAFLSRPCNPTGRVATEEEVGSLNKKIGASPLFVDNAYGNPFPAVSFDDKDPVFAEGIVNTFSFSKVGFPGERVGIAIGSEEVIGDLCAMQSNACIHGALVGQALAAMAVRNEELTSSSVEHIRSYYRGMHELASHLFEYYLSGYRYLIHEAEGAMFTWLYLPTLKSSDIDVYERAKERGVFVVPGSVFFSGVDREQSHIHKCFRVSLTCSGKELERGVKVFCDVVSEFLEKECT